MSRFVEVGPDVHVGRYPQWDVNVGVVVGSAGALVVDTRGTLRQGREARDELRPLLRGRPVVAVAATHVHFDHTFGAGAFDPVTVYAHAAVAVALPTHRDSLLEVVRTELAGDPGAFDAESYSADDLRDLLDTPLRMPDVTFPSTFTLDLGDRLVRLAHAGRGHTDGDIAVHVPDASVTFLGDLVEESAAPSFGSDCWPLDWAPTLDRHLADLAPGAVVVPGHGVPVDADFVAAQRDAIATLVRRIDGAHAYGLSHGEAALEVGDDLPFAPAAVAMAAERAYDALDGMI